MLQMLVLGPFENEPSSATTLWKPPPFTNVTVSPTEIVNEAGVKTSPDPPAVTVKLAAQQGAVLSNNNPTNHRIGLSIRIG